MEDLHAVNRLDKVKEGFGAGGVVRDFTGGLVGRV